ncbi:MAG: hypothetical protein ACM3PY_05730 [Omnitrophica WOR_2 bacterium]
MILGIFSDASSAEILLNNLSEADFDLADVSIIMVDQKLRDKIAKDTGPLKNARFDQISAHLVQAGLSAQEAQAYQDAVAQGKVLAVMHIAPDLVEIAKEMFSDQSGESIREIQT